MYITRCSMSKLETAPSSSMLKNIMWIVWILCTFPGIHGYTFTIQREKSFGWTAQHCKCWCLSLDLVQMAPDLTEDDLQILVDAYKGLAHRTSEEVRQACVKKSLVHDIFMHTSSYLCANQFLSPTASLVPVTQPESFTPMKFLNPTSRSVECSWLHLSNSHNVMVYVLHVHPILIILVVYMHLVWKGTAHWHVSPRTHQKDHTLCQIYHFDTKCDVLDRS